MDDLGCNDWLREHYGTTIDGMPLFRVIWSTGVTEKRKSRWLDFHDEILIRDVVEVRDALKYPFAQDRWVLERLTPVPIELYDVELFTKYSYEAIYIFQNSKTGEYLPLDKGILEVAMYFYLITCERTVPERMRLITERLANREKARKEELRARIGNALRSPYFFVRE